MPADEKTPGHVRQSVDSESFMSAIEAAALPIAANRFEVLPANIAGHYILAIGGAIAGHIGPSPEPSESDRQFAVARMHAGYVLNREIIADMVVKLQRIVHLTTDEMEAAQQKFAGTANE